MKRNLFILFLICTLFFIAVLPVSAAGLTLEATNQDELISALNMTQVVDAINITQSFTVDKNCAITYGADKINYYSETVMTVENGVTLTLCGDGALGSVWATFEGNWDDPILPNGKCINNGTLILEKNSPFTALAEKYGAEQVIYAHCHGEQRFHDSLEGRHHGITYTLVSGDYLRWMPLKIL